MLFLRLRWALALPAGAPTPASEERARRGSPSGARGPVAVASTTRNFRCASNFTRINSLVAGGALAERRFRPRLGAGKQKYSESRMRRFPAEETPGRGAGFEREDEEAGPGSFGVGRREIFRGVRRGRRAGRRGLRARH